MMKLPVKLIVLIFYIYLPFNAIADNRERTLLLVGNKDLNIPMLTSAEVRKLFLGVPIIKKGFILKPIRNMSDPLLTEVFLQKVIFMSEQTYERQLLSRIFHRGGERPLIFSNNSELANALQQSPEALTYMWSKQFKNVSGVKSLGVLWTGVIE